MKITIEPTNKRQTQTYIKSGSIECIYPVVTLEHPEDDMTISEVLDCIIIPALKAYGFPESVINDYLLAETDNTTI